MADAAKQLSKNQLPVAQFHDKTVKLNVANDKQFTAETD